MIETLNLILKIIESDIFLSYAYYTLLFFVLSIFVKSEVTYRVDDIFTDFLIHSGVFFFLIIILKSILLISMPNLFNGEQEVDMMFGKNWLGYWFLPIVHFTATQLLRFNNVKRYFLSRFVLVFILVFTWERYGAFSAYQSIRYIESTYPDYKSDALKDFTPLFIFKHISLRILIYGMMAYIYFKISNKIKDVVSKYKNTKVSSIE